MPDKRPPAIPDAHRAIRNLDTLAPTVTAGARVSRFRLSASLRPERRGRDSVTVVFLR